MVQRSFQNRVRGPVTLQTSFARRRRRKPRVFLWVAFLPLILLSGVLVNWTYLAQQTFAAPLASSSTPGHNTLQQFQAEGQPNSKNKGTFQRPSNPASALKPNSSKAKNKQSPSIEPATMKDATFVLDNSFVQHRPAMKQNSQAAKVKGTAIPTGTTSFAIKGSDGRLEVDVPRGALDATHAQLADGSAPVGQLLLEGVQYFRLIRTLRAGFTTRNRRYQ